MCLGFRDRSWTSIPPRAQSAQAASLLQGRADVGARRGPHTARDGDPVYCSKYIRVWGAQHRPGQACSKPEGIASPQRGRVLTRATMVRAIVVQIRQCAAASADPPLPLSPLPPPQIVAERIARHTMRRGAATINTETESLAVRAPHGSPWEPQYIVMPTRTPTHSDEGVRRFARCHAKRSTLYRPRMVGDSDSARSCTADRKRGSCIRNRTVARGARAVASSGRGGTPAST